MLYSTSKSPDLNLPGTQGRLGWLGAHSVGCELLRSDPVHAPACRTNLKLELNWHYGPGLFTLLSRVCQCTSIPCGICTNIPCTNILHKYIFVHKYNLRCKADSLCDHGKGRRRLGGRHPSHPPWARPGTRPVAACCNGEGRTNDDEKTKCCDRRIHSWHNKARMVLDR